MRRRFRVGPIVTALGMAQAALLLLYAPQGWLWDILRIGVGVPLVLVLPGYALTVAIFPRRPNDDRSLTRIERFAWTLGLSMALSVLGAFLLNLLPGGLTTGSWVALLGGTTMVAAVVARARQPAGFALAPSPHAITIATGPRLGSRQAVIALLAAALIVADGLIAVDLARRSESSVQHPGFVQLWLVPETDDVGAASKGQLGVHSYEADDHSYWLVLRQDREVVDAWSFDLSPGEVWRKRVDLGLGSRIDAELYRDGAQSPYRRVSLGSR